ncbi:MAG: alginate lyase family protein [Bacteroidales bacterium]|nr:alginate lyase family protein [Bacteroidales bacterium]
MNRLITLFASLLLFGWMQLCNARVAPILWDMEELDSVRAAGPSDSAYKAYVRQADIYLCHATPNVMDKPISWSGDKHNFESVAPYYWPNPADPNGKYIVRDGEVNPDYGKYDRRRIDQLAQRIKAFAIARYVTGDERYMAGLFHDVHVWFIDDSSRMNPHFQYAQIKPTYTTVGVPAGIIEGYNLIEIIDAFRLMTQLGVMPDAERRALQKWCRDLSIWLTDGENGRLEAKMPNNHSTAYDVLVYSLCRYCGRNRTARHIARDFGTLRVMAQIDGQGLQPEELKRTTAYKYSIYNVTHIIDFSIMRKNEGHSDYLRYAERVTLALRYLHSFVGRREAFPYQQIVDWELNEADCLVQLGRWQNLLNDE